MKKLVTLAVAAVMALSTASVAFAASDVDYRVTTVNEQYYKYDSDEGRMESEPPAYVGYGDTIYYRLENEEGSTVPVSEYDAVKGISIKKSWEMNGNAVDKIEIVKKKYGDSAAEYAYYLALTFKSSSSTSEIDVLGTLTLKKSGNNGILNIKNDSNEIDFAVNLTVGYPYAGNSDDYDADSIYDDAVIYNFSSSGKAQIEADTEYELRLVDVDEDSYFTVNTKGQGKILLSCNNNYNNDIAAKYPNASLSFVNGNGATFNQSGVLTLRADEGSYLYAVSSNGSLTKVKAEYDEYEGAFKIKTRTLGRYVISDTELRLSGSSSSSSRPSSSSDDEDEVIVSTDPNQVISGSTSTPTTGNNNNITIPVNPSTGAAC